MRRYWPGFGFDAWWWSITAAIFAFGAAVLLLERSWAAVIPLAFAAMSVRLAVKKWRG